MSDSTVLRVLETPDEMVALENLQRMVWPGSELEIVPGHLLLTAAHNGGVVIGAYQPPAVPEEGGAEPELVGFVFGFPGFYETPDGPRLKHCSHMLGVRPGCREKGLGFRLKRAQWQMVRRQGIDLITWTYDPLLSRNAWLNIGRLGAVCNTYHVNEYGEIHDDLNRGLPTDRFQVDWWVHSTRVERRLSEAARPPLELAQYLAGGADLLNPTQIGPGGWRRPLEVDSQRLASLAIPLSEAPEQPGEPLVLLEIPSDFLALKAADPALGLEWRLHTRLLFTTLFEHGYIVTDFLVQPADQAGETLRSFYVLSHTRASIGGIQVTGRPHDNF